MDTTQIIRVQLEATSPDELTVPTADVRWWVSGDYCGFPLVTIEGESAKVEEFVRLHWGDATVDDNYMNDFSPPENVWELWAADHKAD